MRTALKILLVAGGWSPERDVSLKGAEKVAQTLRERGHSVTRFDLSDGFEALLDLAKHHDCAFLNLHGAPGEDGLVQALLDQAGCPYQGSGPAGSFLALHKAAAKALFRQAGLATPAWSFLPLPPGNGWKPSLAYPLFVKSNSSGSSLHLYRAGNRAELDDALQTLFAAGQEALIEEMIKGREITCGVLAHGANGETLALPPVLILPKGEFFDYHDKYAADGAQEICPAPLPEEIIQQIQRNALTAHHCLGLRGYSRADFILTQEDQLFLLEVNTLPGMTAASLLPREAAAMGLEFGDLLEKLIESSGHTSNTRT